MKNSSVVLSMALVLGGFALAAPAVGDIGGLESLRGMKELDATNPAPDMKKFNLDEQPVKRNYVQQPPVIPHKIRGYQVDLRANKCLSCHSWDRYKQAGATKVSLTHFETREGHALADISPRRYFCLQCHVPQAGVQPLVGNRYQSTSDLKR